MAQSPVGSAGIDNNKVSFRVGTGVPTNPPAGSINMDEDTGAVYVAGSSETIQLKDTTKAPISHASSGTAYGISTAAYYGHAKASGTTPKANGTAAVGSETASFARGDHVHPLQTTVSGNAGTATKLATARTINGTSFDGSANITTANWGTARTITIGSTGKSVNGSGNVSWNLNELGAVSGGFHVSQSGKTAAGWYRIATSAPSINNCNGIFIISGQASGVHNSVILAAGTSYGVTSGTYLNQLGCASYNSTNITKARIVYNTTYSNNYAYLEIYVSTATSTTIDAKFFGTGWQRVDATAGSIPSGYTSKEISFTNAYGFVGSLSGNATTATTASKLSTNAGSATQPVYFNNGVPVATTYTLGASVPADAKFTDTVYTLPLATASVRGGVKIGYTANGKNYPVQLSSEQMYVNVPWTDNNTWIAFKGATSSAAGTAGYVPAPASGQTGLFFRSDGTWASPANTQYSNMTGATASSAGTAGLVPAPAAGKQTSFLRGDGTWVIPTDTNTHYTANLITSNSATGTTQYAGTEPTTNVYLNLIENSTVRNSHKIVGSGIVSVNTTSTGQINVKGPSFLNASTNAAFPIYFSPESAPSSLANMYIGYNSSITLNPSTGVLDGVTIDGGSID